ncbi:MAG: GDP-mannose 4,6-dehydratase [Actinobacteria bacterium]|nr:GDP-mannose 4,6-dehydratase [Actinomycetota bacterium]MCL6105303.1 GDP-mannose 4,6-dehydratase [Actinomycetota bacterium]
MRVFVTGANGFVGKWLVAHLKECQDEVLTDNVLSGDQVDITDAKALYQALEVTKPEIVYHLAAFTHVGHSWDEPDRVMQVNIVGTHNLLEAVRKLKDIPRVLLVSSSEVYGVPAAGNLPLTEEAPFAPVTPYAASKAASEMLGVAAWLGRGVEVIRLRPFNHIGPGQDVSFVVAGLAQRIKDARDNAITTLSVGNLYPRRDFTDVRDVVRAYRMLGQKGKPGDVYNVCSGKDVSIEQIVIDLMDISGIRLSLIPDPKLQRNVDIPIIYGDPTKLKLTTDWEPQISLQSTLEEVIKNNGSN